MLLRTRGRRHAKRPWRRRFGFVLLGLLLVAGAGLLTLWHDPTLLRTGSRGASPKGGPVDPLSVRCEGDVVDGFCGDAGSIARELQSLPFEILESHIAADGVTRPQRLRIRVHRREGESAIYRVKWRQVPDSLDEANNSPRRELASYAIQSLLFEPGRRVVLPTVLRCLTLEQSQRLVESSVFPGSRCVLGALSLWLEGASELSAEVADSATGPLAARLGDVNVFAVLSEHRDAIGRNFLVVGRPPQRAFVVDGGTTFGARKYHPLGFFGATWSRWRDYPVHPTTQSRLRGLQSRDLDSLRTVAQLELDEAGVYRSVPPSAPWNGPDVERGPPGVRRKGSGIQLGLTAEQIAAVKERKQSLLEKLPVSGTL